MLGLNTREETTVDEHLYHLDLQIAEAKARVKELQAERRLALMKRNQKISPAAGATPATVPVNLDCVRLRWVNLSTRARNDAMSYLGIDTVGELVKLSAKEILRHHNVGLATVQEYRDLLLTFGLKLKGDE